MAGPGASAAGYQLAYRMAATDLASRDLAEVARRAGARLDGRRLHLAWLGNPVEVEPPREPGGEAEFQPADLTLAEKILILHYLLSTDRQPVRGRQVSFKQLPGASFYEPTYRQRGPERIARRFGREPEAFRRACRRLGWEPAELGDVSFGFEVFPRLRGVVVLHRGDEEFPPEANLLFEDRIVNLLPLEDVAVLAGLIATRLGKAAQESGRQTENSLPAS
jgi:hypothetical protein